jgi:hypothetical protein
MGREPDIQGEQNRTSVENAVVGFEQAMAVHAEEGDSIAGLHAGCAQRARQQCGTLRKFRVRESQIAANDSSSARKLLFRVSQTSKWCERNIHVESSAV